MRVKRQAGYCSVTFAPFSLRTTGNNHDFILHNVINTVNHCVWSLVVLKKTIKKNNRLIARGVREPASKRYLPCSDGNPGAGHIEEEAVTEFVGHHGRGSQPGAV